MLTQEDNELLTHVEGDAPMGQMLREHHWFPAVRSAKLVADKAPMRVRLLGKNYVAFRATDGRVGLFDEACPHRGASLMLARNEDCALRCIYHGWKFDVSGKVVDVPIVSHEPEKFAAKVKLNHYPVREAGGIVWTYLGAQAKPPQFPAFGFTNFPTEHVNVAVTTLPFNWVQALDATVDSAHIGFLHSDWMDTRNEIYEAAVANRAPSYDVEDRPYGFRGAALRPMADGTTHVRITEYIMPFYTSQPIQKGTYGSFQMLVPVDDVTTNWWFVRWSKTLPIELGKLAPEGSSLDNWVPLPGDVRDNWGQDRDSMHEGSYSGFSELSILTEDTVCQASMGPIVDRSIETLTAADKAVVRARHLLLQAAREHMAGKRPVGADPSIDYGEIHGCMGSVPSNERWQDHLTYSRESWAFSKAS